MSEATDRDTVLATVPRHLLIDGQWRSAATGGTFPVDDPATGKTLIEVADGTAQDALDAMTAAADAQAAWAATAPRERSEILRLAYEMLTERTEEFALLMTLEMGKPLAESRAEVAYAADFFRWFAEEAVRVRGHYSTAPAGTARILTMRQPVGPCLVITPWNFPLAMGTRKLGPALAAGCTAVVKPARQTPLCTLLLGQVLLDAGLPPGVVNIVTTARAGEVVEPLLDDPRLRKLTFTGSTAVGRHLAERAGARLLRVSLELGGNAPLLVFDDADLDLAVEQALRAKFRNVGQACTAANRLLVAAGVADDFAHRYAIRVAGMPVGPGTTDGVAIGPVIDGAARDQLALLVEEAVQEGATALAGGYALPGDGYFFEPTVLTGVDPGSRIVTEEIFGPVAPIMTFADEAEAIARANDTEYGLMAYVFTRDVDRALRVSEALEFGMVGLNSGVISNPAAPFGGIKASGLGREGGAEGIEEYLSVKYIGMPR